MPVRLKSVKDKNSLRQAASRQRSAYHSGTQASSSVALAKPISEHKLRMQYCGS
jgi:hypothetical protein